MVSATRRSRMSRPVHGALSCGILLIGGSGTREMNEADVLTSIIWLAIEDYSGLWEEINVGRITIT